MNDPWASLRTFTESRIGQGSVGCATPTQANLDFQLAHACARDAVHQPWPIEPFAQALTALGLESLILSTPIQNRSQYLQRPDLGRRLDEHSRQCLQARSATHSDVSLVISNGLSSTALDKHGLPLLNAIIGAYRRCNLTLAPVCLLANARVAVADEIGAGLNSRLAVIIVGERPGLSAADSLGIYLTYRPQPGNTDAERNCLSNIRPPNGLAYEDAATKLIYLSNLALQRGLSGVALKDEMPLHIN